MECNTHWLRHVTAAEQLQPEFPIAKRSNKHVGATCTTRFGLHAGESTEGNDRYRQPFSSWKYCILQLSLSSMMGMVMPSQLKEEELDTILRDLERHDIIVDGKWAAFSTSFSVSRTRTRSV